MEAFLTLLLGINRIIDCAGFRGAGKLGPQHYQLNLTTGLLGMPNFSNPSMLAKFSTWLTCLFVFMATHGFAQDGLTSAAIPSRVTRSESGQLPKVPTVESMLRPNPSLEAVLSRTPKESAYEKASIQSESRSRTNDDDIPWGDSLAGWTPPAFYTRPLYFEQSQFERYVSNTPEWTQPVVSYAQFLGTVPVLPYKLGANHPRSRVYTPGHYPYDQVAPPHSHRGKLSKKGLLLQGAATTGLIFFIP